MTKIVQLDKPCPDSDDVVEGNCEDVSWMWVVATSTHVSLCGDLLHTVIAYWYDVTTLNTFHKFDELKLPKQVYSSRRTQKRSTKDTNIDSLYLGQLFTYHKRVGSAHKTIIFCLKKTHVSPIPVLYFTFCAF